MTATEAIDRADPADMGNETEHFASRVPAAFVRCVAATSACRWSAAVERSRCIHREMVLPGGPS